MVITRDRQHMSPVDDPNDLEHSTQVPNTQTDVRQHDIAVFENGEDTTPRREGNATMVNPLN
jgi:hypothetical protein